MKCSSLGLTFKLVGDVCDATGHSHCVVPVCRGAGSDLTDLTQLSVQPLTCFSAAAEGTAGQT